MTQPINNYAVGNKLRIITQRSWDARLNDDITPVIIVNPEDLAIQATTTGFIKNSSVQTIINYSTAKAGQAITAATGYKIRDVTAGKSFYLSSIQLSTNAAGILISLIEGSVGGTVLMTAYKQTAGDSIAIVFKTPLKFTSSVWLDVSGNATVWASAQGWEE